ncbi:hypothetical protein BHU72_05730 [Desulfuribacillus stibiiarsenatis]|uniref:HD-GYP domain-containing protein n=1 Tax=Desulfuribacillus stibiiarsenatis TaxID=1390249 RepID=A0A1E5L4S2_9FIRM|nr:HD domain-containing phosphohydrolase [Desulfuribacillus stibiiarsenatis]OEH85110.1 hypothetical protein BHU72_05730 [Desulfuribacillus stibiiarsenatis]
MKQKHIAMIQDVALLFKKHQETILKNWLAIIERENILPNEDEKVYFLEGFERLIKDFITHLSLSNLDAYYEGNAEVAMKVAYNDIDFKTFIRVFHFFEESYAKILMDNVPKDQLIDYIGAVDMLHHETIAIVGETYFEVKDHTIFALANLAEQRDPATGKHLDRTREYSVLLAEQMGLDDEFITLLYKVGPLHDIGKVGIRDSILLKPGKLTDEEYEEMKEHTIIGAQTLSKVVHGQQLTRGFYLLGLEIVLSHHERYDGKGYPQGLVGEEIPLAARIFALADAYDAITSTRPYKHPIAHEKAIELIKGDSGTHFDPKVVDAFLAVEEKFNEICKKYQKYNQFC